MKLELAQGGAYQYGLITPDPGVVQNLLIQPVTSLSGGTQLDEVCTKEVYKTSSTVISVHPLQAIQTDRHLPFL